MPRPKAKRASTQKCVKRLNQVKNSPLLDELWTNRLTIPKSRGMALGEFHKMHGLGNDFVIIDARVTHVDISPARARAIAHRQQGIGCDQIIVITASDQADIAMQIYNADGGEVEACGNASRCVVAFLGQDTSIETRGGVISGRIAGNDVIIDMGMAKFDWQDIPLAFAMDSASMPMAWEELAAPVAVNVGNPHAVFFVPDTDAVDLERLGPIIEHDAAFPERVNVNIATVEQGEIRLRVWERGVGLTRACGTGACATGVAAIRQGIVRSPVIVHLPGGPLSIAWAPGEPIIMTGGTTYVFEGEADWNNFV